MDAAPEPRDEATRPASRTEEELVASTVSPAADEQAQPFDEQVTATEEPQHVRGEPGSRDTGLPPEDTGPADRPQ